MTLEPSSAALLLAGFAAAVVATLAVPTGRGAPRPTTLGLAAAVSLAWPVCGFPLPAAVAAVVAVGLALARDLRRPGGRRVRGRPALGLFGGLATAFVIGGLAAAETHRIDLEAAKPAARPAQRVTPSRETARTPTARTEAASPAPARRGTRRAVPAPTEPPAAAAGLPRPETFVRDYYEHLDAKRFRRAWASLSAGVRASFGGFDGWRGGYRRTIFSTPSEFAVAGSTVTHVLVARDRGCPERRFRVRWRLEPAGGAWTVVALSASPLDEVVCR